MKRALFTLLFGLGCGTMSPAVDAGLVLVVDAGADAGSVVMDSGLADSGIGDAGVVDAGVPDAGVTTSDAGASVDAGTLGLSLVQCHSGRRCPGASTCTATAPGGVCNGCGSDTDCPSGTTCGNFAACVRDCQRDADCGGALRCTTMGLCAIRTCSATTACPAPYVCSGTLCQRPSCDGGCPSAMTCSGSVCVEP